MWRVALPLATLLTLGAASWAEDSPTPSLNIYTALGGGVEEVVVEKSIHLSHLALKKGVRWQVLARQNNLKKPYHLKKGMTLTVDNTHIIPTDISHGILINLPELSLYHFANGAYQRRYALAVGRRSWPTPTGDYQIVNKARNPTWIVPASIQEEMANSGKEVVERVPPGPQNPLGEYWLGTSAPGVGIHATNRPWSIGNSASHGCIRMLPGDIADLFPQVEVGTPVKIIYQPIKMAMVGERLYLETHPDIYGKQRSYLEVVKYVAERYRLSSRIDWDKAAHVAKAKEGIAMDITLAPAPGRPGSKTAESGRPRELGLFPLQPQEAKIE
jgi:L,D-transpeptidase ErfK/SrfK